MFDTESRLTLQSIGRRLWRISRLLNYPHTHTLIVDSNADSQKIGLWVWAFIATRAYLSSSSCFPLIAASTPTCVRVLIFPQEIYGHGAHHGPKLGVKIGKRLRRSLRRDKNVGLGPAATRNEKTDLGQTPAQKVPQ